MKTTARVVVIGGGVVGVSTLYHLAKMGWSDVVLIERKELTSAPPGTRRACCRCSTSAIRSASCTIFGRPLPAPEGRNRADVGFRPVTNIRLARTPDRMDEYKYYAGVARPSASMSSS